MDSREALGALPFGGEGVERDVGALPDGACLVDQAEAIAMAEEMIAYCTATTSCSAAHTQATSRGHYAERRVAALIAAAWSSTWRSTSWPAGSIRPTVSYA
ncbi:hypothetical protein AB0392_14730 [Nonomuraea angiospora]|uniref:hypothetical protein n=1 Tax=Nonomuraea angiospora TaxID=46172 RepID=UPI0034508DFE